MLVCKCATSICWPTQSASCASRPAPRSITESWQADASCSITELWQAATPAPHSIIELWPAAAPAPRSKIPQRQLNELPNTLFWEGWLRTMNNSSLVQFLHTQSCADYHAYLDCSVTRCRDNVFVIEVHDIDSSAVADQHSTQVDVSWRLHVPDSNRAILAKVKQVHNVTIHEPVFAWLSSSMTTASIQPTHYTQCDTWKIIQ